VLSELVSKAVDDFIQQDADTSIDRIIKLSLYLRRELLENRDTWKFNGMLDDFNNPPLVHYSNFCLNRFSLVLIPNMPTSSDNTIFSLSLRSGG